MEEEEEDDGLLHIQKALLSRPFGRFSVPILGGNNKKKNKTNVSQEQQQEQRSLPYLVDIAPEPIWDEMEQLWKYQILIEQRNKYTNATTGPTTTGPATTPATTTKATTTTTSSTTAFTQALTYRSLQDFFWLEEYLRLEYQGALLIPLLRTALITNTTTTTENRQNNNNNTTATTTTSNNESLVLPKKQNGPPPPSVTCETLQLWLSDLLNGIRGQGEWSLMASSSSQLLPTTRTTTTRCNSFRYTNDNVMVVEEEDKDTVNGPTTRIGTTSNWMESEVLEAFLYKNSTSLQQEQDPIVVVLESIPVHIQTLLLQQTRRHYSGYNNDDDDSHEQQHHHSHDRQQQTEHSQDSDMSLQELQEQGEGLVECVKKKNEAEDDDEKSDNIAHAGILSCTDDRILRMRHETRNHHNHYKKKRLLGNGGSHRHGGGRHCDDDDEEEEESSTPSFVQQLLHLVPYQLGELCIGPTPTGGTTTTALCHPYYYYVGVVNSNNNNNNNNRNHTTTMTKKTKKKTTTSQNSGNASQWSGNNSSSGSSSSSSSPTGAQDATSLDLSSTWTARDAMNLLSLPQEHQQKKKKKKKITNAKDKEEKEGMDNTAILFQGGGRGRRKGGDIMLDQPQTGPRRRLRLRHQGTMSTTTTTPMTTANLIPRLMPYRSRALASAQSLEFLDSFGGEDKQDEGDGGGGGRRQQQQRESYLSGDEYDDEQRRRQGLSSSVRSSSYYDLTNPQEISGARIPSPTSNKGGVTTMGLAIHSEAIEAQQDLLWNYRQTALLARDKSLALVRAEESLGMAWKKLAITMTNLFSYEKEVEMANHGNGKDGSSSSSSAGKNNNKLGEAFKVKKENLPYRKVTKAIVEEGLHGLAQGKAERGLPALVLWQELLGAYIDDLSSVRPSVDMYLAAIHTLPLFEQEYHCQPPLSMSSMQRQPKASSSSSSSSFGMPITETHVSTTRTTPSSKRSMTRHIGGVGDNHSSSGCSANSDYNNKKNKNNRMTHPTAGNASPSSLHPSQRAYPQRVLARERQLCDALTRLSRATPLRVARMAWWYLKTEATQCISLYTAAKTVRTSIASAQKDSVVTQTAIRHQQAQVMDDQTELELTERILNLRNKTKYMSLSSAVSLSSNQQQQDKDKDQEDDDDDDHEEEKGGDIKGSNACIEQEIAHLRERALDAVRNRLGRWDSQVGWAVMEAVGIDDPIVRMEDATRDLKIINKYASGLRECLNKCIEAIEQVRACISPSNNHQNKTDRNSNNTDQSTKASHNSTTDSSSHKNTDTNTTSRSRSSILELRKSLVFEMAKLFSGRFIDHDDDGLFSHDTKSKRTMPSLSVLTRAGIDMTDPLGWMTALNCQQKHPVQQYPLPRQEEHKQRNRSSGTGNVGDLFFAYMEARDSRTECLLDNLTDLLREYQDRVEMVEGYLFMQCVGIKLEKYFNEKRTKALTAFERKTDITSAMNVATRKRLPHLVTELQSKLDSLGPEVSHTVVKETKELHLESKVIKSELSDLAVRRLVRARESSTEKAIALLTCWAKEEESCSAFDLKALGEAMSALEKNVIVTDQDVAMATAAIGGSLQKK